MLRKKLGFNSDKSRMETKDLQNRWEKNYIGPLLAYKLNIYW